MTSLEQQRREIEERTLARSARWAVIGGDRWILTSDWWRLNTDLWLLQGRGAAVRVRADGSADSWGAGEAARAAARHGGAAGGDAGGPPAERPPHPRHVRRARLPGGGCGQLLHHRDLLAQAQRSGGRKASMEKWEGGSQMGCCWDTENESLNICTPIHSNFLNFIPCKWQWYTTKLIIYQEESESGFGQIAELGFLEIWAIYQVK